MYGNPHSFYILTPVVPRVDLDRRRIVVNGILLLSVVTATVAITPELRDVVLQPLDPEGVDAGDDEFPSQRVDAGAEEPVRLYIEYVYDQAYRSAYALLSPGLRAALPFDTWRADIVESRERFVNGQGLSYRLLNVEVERRHGEQAMLQADILAGGRVVTTEVSARQSDDDRWWVGEAFDPYLLQGVS